MLIFRCYNPSLLIVVIKFVIRFTNIVVIFNNHQIQGNVGTNNWDAHTIFGISGMIVVKSQLCSKFASDRKEKQEDYYQHLSEETIDNFYDETHRRLGRINECAYFGGNPFTSTDGELIDYISIHCTSMKNKIKFKETHTA